MSDWKVVPNEPTDEMFYKFKAEWDSEQRRSIDAFSAAYRAMLAAAPTDAPLTRGQVAIETGNKMLRLLEDAWQQGHDAALQALGGFAEGVEAAAKVCDENAGGFCMQRVREVANEIRALPAAPQAEVAELKRQLAAK